MIRAELQSQNNSDKPLKKSTWMFLFVGLVILVLGGGLTVYRFIDTPPSDFPVASTFVIPEGSSVSEIGTLLKEKSYIRSVFFFKLLTRTAYSHPLIQAGNHAFTSPLTTRALIESLTSSTSHTPPAIVTFPEGFSVHDITTYTEDLFTDIDTELVRLHEGYLFPETYFVSSRESLDDLVARMKAEYEKNISPLRDQIAQSGFTEEEVIILASILEREANDETSMRTVSGILQNRLRENIPLQVDATFAYILGKTSAELTLDDLAMESPYNTYLHTGLPPSPIANPGLMAIQAVLNPTPSSYYYYLTGSDGHFYYARDFDEHKLNKARYLN